MLQGRDTLFSDCRLIFGVGLTNVEQQGFGESGALTGFALTDGIGKSTHAHNFNLD